MAAPRFGLNVHTNMAGDPVATARHAEALGFELVSVHRDVLGEASLEAWTLLSWLAAHTSTISVVPNVLAVPNRHSVLLAKMAATLDRLSAGRLVLALGAGAPINAAALHAVGLPDRGPGAALAAVHEAIEVLHGLWEGEPFSHHGPIADLDHAVVAPPPPRPIPIWVGGYGPRMLRLVGEVADGWLPSAFFLPPDAVPPAIDRIRRAARAAGRDPAQLTLAYNIGVLVHDGQPPRPGHVVGGVEQVAAGLAALAGLSFDVLNLWPAIDTAEQRELLAGAVIPAVRDRTE